MTRILFAGAALLALAACDSAPPANKAEDAPPATFPGGEYEITTKVESLKSADGTAPATALKEGASVVEKVCSKDGATPDPALFTAKGDKCTAQTEYARNGRMNLSYTCSRPGHPGQVIDTIDGKYDSKGFEAAVSTGTYFSGSGDYIMTRHLTARRIGDCLAAEDKPAGNTAG